MSCMPKGQGPGPGAYGLPSLVGYPKHDPSRYRNPQFTMRPLCQTTRRTLGPGPAYDITRMTRNGRASAPAYTLTSKPRTMSGFTTPGPGAYTHFEKMKNPAYTIASRQQSLMKSLTPGPNQYNQPSSLGPKVPHLNAAPAYSMIGKSGIAAKFCSPGPANYGGVPVDNYRLKPPKFTIPGQLGKAARSATPGPAAYLPKLARPCNPGFSFGHRVCTSPYITADDDIPCINRHD